MKLTSKHLLQAMSPIRRFWLALIVLVSATTGVVRADEKAAALIVINNTGVPVRLDGTSYTDAAGKEIELTGYWLFAPGEQSPLQFNDRNLVVRVFKFTFTTADGRTTKWQVKTDANDKELRLGLSKEFLAEHQKMLAKARIEGTANVGALCLRLPEGATVSHGGQKIFVDSGCAILHTRELKAGEVTSHKIVVSHTVGGKTITEEGTFYLTANNGQMWDCRDSAQPDKQARTAQFTAHSRAISKEEYAKLGKEVSAEALITVMKNTAKRLDGLPSRGVDEDAIKYANTYIDAVHKLAKETSPTRDQVDAVWQELNDLGQRKNKLLQARYGDSFEEAVARGGAVGERTTSFKPAPTTPPPAVDGNQAQRAKLDGDIRNTNARIAAQQASLTELNNKILVAFGAVKVAERAYNGAETLAEEILAGVALGAARRVYDELLADRDTLNADLRSNRDLLSGFKKARAALGD